MGFIGFPEKNRKCCEPPMIRKPVSLPEQHSRDLLLQLNLDEVKKTGVPYHLIGDGADDWLRNGAKAIGSSFVKKKPLPCFGTDVVPTESKVGMHRKDQSFTPPITQILKNSSSVTFCTLSLEMRTRSIFSSEGSFLIC